MSLRSFPRLTILSLFLLCPSFSMAEQPPVAPVRPVVDEYFGEKIVDPYRYMEDFKQPEVQAWVKSQAEYADAKLRSLPGRQALLARIGELDAGAPFTVSIVARHPNGKLYYLKQLASENVYKLYVRDETTRVERLLIDPETFPKPSPDEHFTLAFFRVSPDGSQILYGYAASGSEQTTIKVFDLSTGRDLPDAIDRVEAEYAWPDWLPDGRSFVYGRRRKLAADAPATEGFKFTQSLRHTLGTDPDNDPVVFGSQATGSPELKEMDFPATIVTRGSDWVVGQVKHGDETDITLYATRRETLGTPEVKWTKVCDRADLVTDFAVRGDDIYLLTAADAPRFKIVRTSLAQPDLSRAAIIVPPSAHVVNSLAVAQDALYVGILTGVPNTIVRVPFVAGAQPEPVELPVDEPSGDFSAVRPDMPGVFIRTRSWIRDGHHFRYDPATKQLVDTGLVAPGPFSSPAGLVATEVLVPSHDGVAVPLSIIHRQGLKLDGSNPTIVYAYGAYGHTIPMGYSPTTLGWLERGGVLAIAHVRGGGAFGKEWHHAGRKQTKPNTWKDFIACGEYLVRERYTSPQRMAGRAGSAGGILIGRAITERPELFAAANIAVGCTDMLRFETTMNGPPNIPEFGTVTKEAEFRGLHAMSTLHHIRDGVAYPAIVLTHGINDPRVEPWESAKATARFQAASSSGRPVLFRVEYHAGHGIGSTRRQQHEERADVWSFFLWQFGDPEFQPK